MSATAIPSLAWTGERCVPGAMPSSHRTLAEHLARYRWAVSQLARRPSNQIVLDVPCGSGYGTAMLAAATHTAIAMGVDIDGAAVEYARYHYGTPGRMLFDSGDMASLRVRADVVVCFEGIEHVSDQVAAARSLCESLKPDGLLLVSTPRVGGPAAGSIYHTRELNRAELVELFAPYLSRIEIHGQDLEVGDVAADCAPYLVLEGWKAR